MSVCKVCGGTGRRMYPNTGTFRTFGGGVYGQALTEDACNVCSVFSLDEIAAWQLWYKTTYNRWPDVADLVDAGIGLAAHAKKGSK